MYTFYTDKTELFECKISLQGAKLEKSRARLVLESEDINLIFYGEIDNEGRCKVPVRQLKSILSENTKGNVKLEVIAEDTYFEPWNDSFDVKTNKKVTVEVKQSKGNLIKENKKTVTVSQINNNIVKITEEFLGILNKKKISLNSLMENKNILNKVGSFFVKKYSLKDKDINLIIENIVYKLSK